MKQFLNDVLTGLQSFPKYLNSKYFYDKRGDELFQKIMASEEYYPTNCEMEIFASQKEEMARVVINQIRQMDLVEFGPGDAVKSIHLIKELFERNALQTYFPVDISANIIEILRKKMTVEIPGLNMRGMNGEYFEMLEKIKQESVNNKLVLFLGGNIGNFEQDQVRSFCKKLQVSLLPGDLVLIGFDLKKNPQKILNAYNDAGGITSEFNLNLLTRINNELQGDFDISAFEHYATYDPGNGACKSYLVSLKEQNVHIGTNPIHFEKDETIFMEISQKYTLSQIDETAVGSGFESIAHFFDSEKNFVDVLWRRV
ncbi:MAG: L-histidine N(alpha)-methyltransferase [Ginsengibacter sp.]